MRGWLAILGGGFAPGALAGIQLAGLIFYLNPRLPFAFGPVLRGSVIYGTLIGAVSLALHLPFTWRRPRRARRVLAWSFTAALAVSALLDWSHASYFAYFLPPGINDRLIKTALWLTLGTLIAFYTALLHSLSRRRYGRRSRWGLTLVAVLSIYAMVERREAFHPRPAPTPRPAVVEAGQRPKLWVIGIDSATLDAILPLAGQGRLPFLATVLQNGAYGRLSSIVPTRRDALWTTLATGKYPFKTRHHRPARLPRALPRSRRRAAPPPHGDLLPALGRAGRQARCRRARRGARRWRSGRSCRGSAFPPAWSAGRRPTRRPARPPSRSGKTLHGRSRPGPPAAGSWP